MPEHIIKRALISVFNKEGLDRVVESLHKRGVEIVSTGGTQEYIQNLGIPCTSVEDITTYPSILGGRVKTLHPQIFGAILSRRDNEDDQKQCEMYGISALDLVVVDLYPFKETVAAGGSHQQIIEKIDIGGVSLIRAAAKNYQDVVIIPSRGFYPQLIEFMEKQNGTTTLEQRKNLAKAAFGLTSDYDHEVFHYFWDSKIEDELPENRIDISFPTAKQLRYGENPHQKAVYYGTALEERFDILHGKALSYNNMLDVDAAVHLIEEFEAPTAAILKHNTPCGVASRETILEAYETALACDPVSAFGGIIVLNREVDLQVAEKISEIFFEVLIAPNFTEEALEKLKEKKNRILLRDKIGMDADKFTYRTILGGLLAQERDTKIESLKDLNATNEHLATDHQLDDLLFGMKVVKYCKSNAIVLARDCQVLGAGYGQTSRVDALKQAISKAHEMGFTTEGASLASDAFFPFSDCVEIASEAGIEAIIQPGGSIRDEESIQMAKEKNIAMYLTGIRHFRH